MDIILPVDVTPSLLVSSNIADSTEVEWSPIAAYEVGDKVKVSYEEDGVTAIAPVFEFTCMTAHDGSADPSEAQYPPDDDGTYWLNTGASNRWRWGDSYINTQTVADGTEATDAGKIVMTFNANKCTAIALFGVVANQIAFDRYDSGGELIDTATTRLQNAATYGDAWSYCFEDFVYEHDVIQTFGIRHVQTVKITIEHTPSAGLYPKIGYAVIGRNVYVGRTKYDCETGISDYSKKITDETFGNTYLRQGNYSKWMELDIYVPTNDVDRVQQALTSIRGKATVFNGNNSGTSRQVLNILGFWADFSNTMKGPRESKYQLEIKGLI